MVNIPRNRNLTFEPQLIKKREVIIEGGTEDTILLLYAKGMSVKDIQNYMDMSYLHKQYQN